MKTTIGIIVCMLLVSACGKTSEPSTLEESNRGAGSCGLITGNDRVPALASNASFRSCNGKYTLVMQGDGNLVLHQGNAYGVVIWNSGTWGNTEASLYLYANGRLILRGKYGKALKVFGEAGGRARFQVQGDGNMVLYTSAGKPVWSRF